MKLYFLPLLLLFFFAGIICSKIIRTVAGIPPFGGDGKLAIEASIRTPYDVVVTSKNELYISDSGNQVIRKVNKNGIISTIAGIAGKIDYSGDNGLATEAYLHFPSKLFFSEEKNELFICDTMNYAIRKIDSNGIIKTIAGGNGMGVKGDNGPAKNASLGPPNCIFVSPSTEEIFICDGNNHIIRKVFTNGTITTAVGIIGQSGYSGDGANALYAKLNYPSAVFVTFSNDMYIADTRNNVIRKVFQNGTIITVVGMNQLCGFSGDGGSPQKARLCEPRSVFVTSDEELFIADSANCAIRRVVNTTVISAIIGQGEWSCGYTGDYGSAEDATLAYFYSLFVSQNKQIYIADTANNVIRKIGTDGIIVPVAGISMESDMVNTEWKISNLNTPRGVYVTLANEMYISDTMNHVIKKVDKFGKTSIVAGIEGSLGSNCQIENVPAISVRLNRPTGIFYCERTQELFVADSGNHCIRKIDSNGSIYTVLHVDLKLPSAIFVSNISNAMYIADTENHVIKKFYFDNSTVVVVAGNGQDGTFGYRGDGDLATEATLGHPMSVIETSRGDIYIGDGSCMVIRHIFPNGTITTVINSDTNGMGLFCNENTGDLYFTNYLSINKISYKNNSIERVVGNERVKSFSGDDLDPSLATFYSIVGIFQSQSGSLYICDAGNHVIRKISDLCETYSIESVFHTSTNESSKNLNVYSQINRTCTSHTDAFDWNYLPLLEIQHKTTREEWKTIVLNWNQEQVTASIDITGQTLDILSIILNACVKARYSNCSLNSEIGVVPTTTANNFIFIPGIISTTFINFFKTSSLVSSLNVTVSFINSITKQVDARKEIKSGSSTVEVVGLNPSTVYDVLIQSKVKYVNGMEFRSFDSIQQIKTQTVILPSSSVEELELFIQEDSFVIAWKEIPKEKRGNLPLFKLEIEYYYDPMNRKILFLEYDSTNNIPNSYAITSIQRDKNYVILVRAIHCSNITSRIDGMLSSSNFNIQITVGVIISIFILLFVVSIIFIVVILCCVVWRIRYLQHKNNFNSIELPENTIRKDFFIEESKLDFSNSRVIGHGASGSVTTAKYFNMEVAVKMIPKQMLGVENDLNEFYNELKFMNRNTQHVNIIRFFGMYNVEKFVGLVMEYCPNGTVSNYISHHNICFKTKIELLKGIADGMQYLHFQDIAHRDLKCENILLDSSLTPKIIDFGFSREIFENQSMNLTMNVGTAVYCAPELIKSQLESDLFYDSQHSNSTSQLTEPLLEKLSTDYSGNSTSKKKLAYDKKCDVYSFSIVIYVIYFRQLYPYGTTTANQIMYQLSKNPQLRPPVNDSLIPFEEKWLIELMRQCWNTDPVFRPTFEQISSKLSSQIES